MTKKSKRKIPLPPFSPLEILKLFKTRQDRAITFTQIAQALDVAPDQRTELRRTLRDLIENRQITKLDRRHYSLPSRAKVVIGRVQAHRDGYGFLIPEDSRLPEISGSHGG